MSYPFLKKLKFPTDGRLKRKAARNGADDVEATDPTEGSSIVAFPVMTSYRVIVSSDDELSRFGSVDRQQ